MNIFSNTPPPPYECAFEKDFNPPLDLNSEAHKLYLQAREFQYAKPYRTPQEEENITAMFLEAAQQGHWKAKAEMVYRYANAVGTDPSSAYASDLAEELAKAGVPIGYFNLGLFISEGRGVIRDEKKGMELIHKAAELGSPDAQYMLGEHYIYSKYDAVRGFKYHVCAMRQGHGKSINAIAAFLKIEKNYPMAVEYLLRAGGQGSREALIMLKVAFLSDNPTANWGFNHSPAMADYVSKHYDLLLKDPRQRFPNIGKNIKIPEHPILGNGRHLPSKLKEACGGMWPDEAYPELKDW